MPKAASLTLFICWRRLMYPSMDLFSLLGLLRKRFHHPKEHFLFVIIIQQMQSLLGSLVGKRV
ncbi:hypothetical protein D3C81_1578230 [compost metagenome]